MYWEATFETYHSTRWVSGWQSFAYVHDLHLCFIYCESRNCDFLYFTNVAYIFEEYIHWWYNNIPPFNTPKLNCLAHLHHNNSMLHNLSLSVLVEFWSFNISICGNWVSVMEEIQFDRCTIDNVIYIFLQPSRSHSPCLAVGPFTVCVCVSIWPKIWPKHC